MIIFWKEQILGILVTQKSRQGVEKLRLEASLEQVVGGGDACDIGATGVWQTYALPQKEASCLYLFVSYFLSWKMIIMSCLTIYIVF